MQSTEEHLGEFRRDGYTLFKNSLSPTRVASLRAMLDSEFARRHAEHPDRARTTISSILEQETLAPMLTDHILNPRLLNFAEIVMGPNVQLDSFEISGYPSVETSEKGKVAGWHRDAFNLTEQWVTYPFTYQRQPRPYTAPMACNCLTYLQDMTLDSGPLRVIPGSHVDYTYLPKEAQYDSHPQERLISLQAGDMVYTHCELLHSGTLNTSGAIRYFISIYFSYIGLPHRDTFETPTIERIVADARKRNDRRVLRLFGIDEGFQQRQLESWRQLMKEDQAALKID